MNKVRVADCVSLETHVVCLIEGRRESEGMGLCSHGSLVPTAGPRPHTVAP